MSQPGPPLFGGGKVFLRRKYSEVLGGDGVVTDRGVVWSDLLPEAEEDFGTRADWEFQCRFRSEVANQLPSEGVILFVQVKEDMGGLMEQLEAAYARMRRS